MGLKSMIDAEPDMTVVAEASNGHEAIELFREHSDIVLMDLRECPARRCGSHHGHPPEFDARIVVLITYDGDEDLPRLARRSAGLPAQGRSGNDSCPICGQFIRAITVSRQSWRRAWSDGCRSLN